MRIKRLILRNFRCFEHLDLELDEHVTLLVGINGAGKTAVLDGLAIALGAWLKQVTGQGKPIVSSDARLIRQESAGLATSDPSFPVRVEAEVSFAGKDLNWSRELKHRKGRTTLPSGMPTLRLHINALQAAISADDPFHSLPLIAYYGTGRLWVQKRDKPRAELASRMDGYDACLEFASNHTLFERWMADREGDRIQRLAAVQAAGGDLSSVQSPHLDAVEKSALACLEGAQHFYYSINHKELRVEFEDGRALPFTSLSDGQRSLIVLAADIAWRAAQLNPHHGADAPQKTEGIVLIDEIELHLHPQWQRTVVPNLQRAFGKLQFVITTHSPQVVSSAQPEGLRVLHPDGSWDRVEYTYGRASNALLRDVFGIPDRLQHVREQVDRIEDLLAAGDLDGARAALHDLELEVGPDDDLVSGLRWEIHDTEVNGPLVDEDDAKG